MKAKDTMFKEMYDSLKDTQHDLKDVYINYDEMLEHKLVKEAKLTIDDVKKYAFLIKSIIDDYDKCMLDKSENCLNNIGFHQCIIKDGNTIKVIAEECPKRKNFANKYSYKANFLYDSFASQDISKVLINKEYFNTPVDQSVKDIVTKYQSMIKNNEITGMYIYGNFGIGKTYLSMGIANGISKNTNKKIMFIYTSDLVSKLKKGFNNSYLQEINNNLIEDMKKVDYLFLDDIGSEYATDWFYSEYLLNILNERLLANKCTFFNSNLSLDDLEKNIQLKIKNAVNSQVIVGRLMDRIRSLVGNKSILMKGKNRRY